LKLDNNHLEGLPEEKEGAASKREGEEKKSAYPFKDNVPISEPSNLPKIG
jgi:hypothetical protein